MSDRPQKGKSSVQQQQVDDATMAPGDEAPPGTPGTGEDACPACRGSGFIDGDACDTCRGKGRIIKAISAGP